MAGRGDKVEQGVHPIVAEARVTLDAGLLGKNIVVLTLEVARDLTETKKYTSEKLRFYILIFSHFLHFFFLFIFTSKTDVS